MSKPVRFSRTNDLLTKQNQGLSKTNDCIEPSETRIKQNQGSNINTKQGLN